MTSCRPNVLPLISGLFQRTESVWSIEHIDVPAFLILHLIQRHRYDILIARMSNYNSASLVAAVVPRSAYINTQNPGLLDLCPVCFVDNGTGH